MMGHKEKKRSIVWLTDLRAKGYIEWIYSTDFTEKTKPAIYYLGLNGIRLLKSTNDYPLTELRKRYKEPLRKQPFIERCLIVADCCITLKDRSNDDIIYTFTLPADYADRNNPYYFLSQDKLIQPDLCYIKRQNAPEGPTAASYVLQVFDTILPHYQLRYRLKTCVQYLEDGEWQHQTKDKVAPTILLVCPTKAELIYCKRRTRLLLKDVENSKNIVIKFATVEDLQQQGILAGIWEKA